MSGRYAPRVDFDGEPWGAFNQAALKMWASSSEIPSHAVRVMFAALSRLDRTGHAPFKPGELAAILGRPTADSVVTPAVKQRVTDALSAAKRWGMIAEESTARCVVLDPGVFQRPSGGRQPCIHDRRGRDVESADAA